MAKKALPVLVGPRMALREEEPVIRRPLLRRRHAPARDLSLTSGTKRERIRLESAAARESEFVHHRIWWASPRRPTSAPQRSATTRDPVQTDCQIVDFRARQAGRGRLLPKRERGPAEVFWP